MNYELRCEGFSMDEELEEQLLLQCRPIVLETANHEQVAITVRQIEGRVQARIEVALPGRKVSAVVWRSNPVAAVASASDAVMDAVEQGQTAIGSGGTWQGNRESSYSVFQ